MAISTLFLDFTNGNDSNNATSFANRVKTITSGITAARIAPGDTVRIMKTEDPVSLGINATWTNKSDTVTLASALTKNIDLSNGAWTAVSANVVQSNPTTRKEGTASIQFAIASAFTTGQIGYLTMASTDFSAYNKVSFWIKTNLLVATGVLKLLLCSNTIGTTVVNTITINEAIPANTWHCITVDTGGALGAAIQSISFDAISDPGTVNIQLDNILACNNLTLTSLISTSSTATGYGSMNWYPVKSINGTTVKIDSSSQLDASSTGRGFDGATVTATTYKIEPIRIAAGQSTNEGGTNDTTRETFSGGWDTTNMTSQTGLTFIDLGDNSASIITLNQGFLALDHIVAVRGLRGFSNGANNNNIDNCAAIDCSDSGIISAQTYSILTNSEFYNCGNNCVNVTGFAPYQANVKSCNSQVGGFSIAGTNSNFINLTALNNSSDGISVLGGGFYLSKLYGLTSKDNSGFGLIGSTPSIVRGIVTSGNTSGGIKSSNGFMYVDNPSCAEGTPFTNSLNSYLQISRIGGDPAQVKIYDNATTLAISIDTGTVHGSATKSYLHQPQSVHVNSSICLNQKLQPFAVASTGTVTFSIWVQRSNANVGGQIICRGGQSNGVANDVTAVASAGSGVWEQLTITFSPTQAVPIIVELQTWKYPSGIGNVFFSDASVTQV